MVTLLHDMDKEQVPTEDLITESSTFLILYAVLHICKNLINSARNYLLNINGQLFSVAQLFQIYNMSIGGEILRKNMPMKCLYGRDRQSDLNAWTLVSPSTQKALTLSNPITIRIYPEPYLPFKVNKTIQPVIDCTSEMYCSTNLNGDIFIFLHPNRLLAIGHKRFAQLMSIPHEATVYPTRFFGFVHQVCGIKV